MENIIEFKEVSFRYQEDGPWILKNLNFTIQKNESVAIIGHNGSGKSTIAKLMNGLLFPQEGEIFVNGKHLTEETVWDIRENVGMVFQNPDNQFVGATVQDDVAFGMENRCVPRKTMEARITEALNIVSMSEYRFTEPHRLSGGQKQRIAIAGIIAIEPEVMILDEATVMLDPKGRQEMMDTINRLHKEKSLTFVTITHDLKEIIHLDRVIVLNEGEILFNTTPLEVFKKGKQLETIGLALPFIVKLTEHLKDEGMKIKDNPLTIQELLEAL